MLKKIFITILILLIWSISGYTAPRGTLYEVVPGKKSTHEAGKVKMIVFFDFFCPHCHKFDTVVLPLLKREFGDKLEVEAIGFPIIYADSTVPLEAYELAKDMGKGEEMKRAIFDAIYYERKDGANSEILSGIAGSIGLDKEKFKKDLRAGVKRARVLEGKALAQSYGAHGTPTIILDGNILMKKASLASISTVINMILEQDKK